MDATSDIEVTEGKPIALPEPELRWGSSTLQGLGPSALRVSGEGTDAAPVDAAGADAAGTEAARPTVPAPEPPIVPLWESREPQTLCDNGALRDYAQRIATTPQENADALAGAYLEDLRRRTGTDPRHALETAPPPAANAETTAQASTAPTWLPESWLARVFGRPSASSLYHEPAPPAELQAPFNLRSEWRKASPVRKITLVLLPFALAAAFSLRESTEDVPASTSPTSSSVSAHRAPEQRSPAQSPLTGTAQGAAATGGPAPSGTTDPRAMRTTISASAPNPTSDPTANQRHATEPATSSRAPEAPSPSRAASAERDAFKAAFQGKNTEAAMLYGTLATGPKARTFALAARLARENAIRKP
jgi:hypothetical protein